MIRQAQTTMKIHRASSIRLFNKKLFADEIWIIVTNNLSFEC